MGGIQQVENSKKEIRYGELRAADMPDDTETKNTVEGYAVVFEQPTVIFSNGDTDYKEVVDRDALVGADLSDVPFKYNHSENVMVMARTRNKTLTLTVDKMGLNIKAELANTTSGNDMYELIRRGDVDKMSYAYTVAEDSYDHITQTRRILKIKKLYDVSAVDLPAYDQTSISARDYFNAQEEMEKRAVEEQQKSEMEIKRRRLELAEKE